MADIRTYKLCLAIAILVIAAASGYYLHLKSKQADPVAIEDGQTIDFSSGKAVVKDTSEDQAAMEKAKKEIDEATADVTFAPTKKP